MLIRKYTSVAAKYFNLLLSDAGRPLHHISNELEYSRLFEDIETVSRTSHGVYREVFTAKGAPVQIKLLPYSSLSVSRVDTSAVTMTITDLSPRLDAYEDHRARSTTKVHRFPEHPLQTIAKIRILIVDDSESDRQVIKRHLNHIKSLSVETFEAMGIQSALHSLRNDDIDVCLVDYRLGVETADDLSRQIAEHNSQLPVMLMSGYSRRELEGRIPDNLLKTVERNRQPATGMGVSALQMRPHGLLKGHLALPANQQFDMREVVVGALHE